MTSFDRPSFIMFVKALLPLNKLCNTNTIWLYCYGFNA